MNAMKINKPFQSILTMLIYSLVGVVCFCGVTLFLNRNKLGKQQIQLPYVSVRDSCVLNVSDGLLELSREAKGIIVYVEAGTCAACSENAIKEVAQYMHDSVGTSRPMLLYHPPVEIDSSLVKDYHNHFDDYFRVVVSAQDSLMIKNPWMPEYLGIYGIVTDSLDRVLFAGSLFDKRFMDCCIKQTQTTQEI
jgi:hypothetical protein